MEGVTSTGNPNTQRVRPAGPVRLQVTEEQKKSIKQIKEFIRSCLEKDSSLDPTGANISPDRFNDSPASFGSFSSTSSSNTGKILIFKRNIDQVLRKYFQSIDLSKFDIVSNEIFYYMQKQLHYNDTNQLTKDIINIMNGSLTQSVVDKIKYRLESNSESSRQFASPSAAAREGSAYNSPIRLSSPETQSSNIDEVETLLNTLMDLNSNTLSGTDQTGLKSRLISLMAKDIWSKGFFDPTLLTDATQKQFANQFIELLKSDKLQVTPTPLPHESPPNTDALARRLIHFTEQPGSSNSGSNDRESLSDVPKPPVVAPSKKTTEPRGCFSFINRWFGYQVPPDPSLMGSNEYQHYQPL